MPPDDVPHMGYNRMLRVQKHAGLSASQVIVAFYTLVRLHTEDLEWLFLTKFDSIIMIGSKSSVHYE